MKPTVRFVFIMFDANGMACRTKSSIKNAWFMPRFNLMISLNEDNVYQAAKLTGITFSI